MYTVGIRILAVFRYLYTCSIGKCRFCYGKYTFTYSRSKRKTVYNFNCRNGEKAGAQENYKIFRLDPCFFPFSSLNIEGVFFCLSKIKYKEVISVLKTELEVVTVGTPDINYLVKQVTLYDDKIEIQFNAPINISPDDESRRGFSLCSKTIKLSYKVPFRANLVKYEFEVEIHL